MLVELALDTILLLRELMFCTDTIFGTLKIHYQYGRMVIALEFGSDGGFDSHHRRSYFSVPDIFFFLITIFMIFFPS